MGSIAICGKPGGGKSFYAVKLLLTEILVAKDDSGRFRNRQVVTNIPLNLPAIEGYLEKHHKAYYEQIESLPIHAIPIEEEGEIVPEFWRYRDSGVVPVHDSITSAQYKEGIRPDWSKNTFPVVYLLDELHKFLNARNWASTGGVVLDYISQHRHFGDDVFWMTQAVKNVDSQFRSVTQEFRHVRNLQKERIGAFRKGGGFRLSVYQDDRLTAGGEDYSETFKFDKEIGACYSTSIIGGKGDDGEKAKAFPWWLFWVLVIAAAIAGIAFVTFAPEAAAKALVDAEGGDDVEVEDPVPVEVASAATRKAYNVPNLNPLDKLKSSSPLGKVQDLTRVMVPLRKMSLADAVALASDGVGVLPVPSSSAVILSGGKKQVQEFSAILALLDSRADTEPISIRALIATVDLQDGEGSALSVIGELVTAGQANPIRLETLALSSVTEGFSLGADLVAFEAVLELLGTSSRFGVVARPYMSTLSSNKVSFSAGKEIPIQTINQNGTTSTTTTTFRAVELLLEVTPIRTADGSYLVTINQENSDVLEREEGSDVPPLASQKISTVVKAREGEILVLGGMTQDTANRKTSGLFPRRKVLSRLGTVANSSRRFEVVLLLQVTSGNSAVPVEAAKFDINPERPLMTPKPALGSARPAGLPSYSEDMGDAARAKYGARKGIFDKWRKRANRLGTR